MLSRRSARVKVMQIIYALKSGNLKNNDLLNAELENSMLQPVHMLLYLMMLLRELALYSETDTNIKASKYLPNEVDKLPSNVILNNPVVSELISNTEFDKLIQNNMLSARLNKDIVRLLFNQLSASEEFLNYKKLEKRSSEDEVNIIRFIEEEIFRRSEDLDTLMMELFGHWHDDDDLVYIHFNMLLSDLSKGLGISRLSVFADKNKEIFNFGHKLLNNSIGRYDEYSELIAPKIKNWEIDRIAKVDLVLMVMAISEILDFPTIPVKVTINEYIDISKIYSTPKSREFVNGILDKLMKEMNDSGQIVKTGRGLQNN